MAIKYLDSKRIRGIAGTASPASDWTESGSKYTLTGNQIDFALKRDGSYHEAYANLGADASSTWVLRMHINFTGNSSGDGYAKESFWGLSSTTGNWAASQDSAGATMTWAGTGGSGDNRFTVIESDGSAIMDGSDGSRVTYANHVVTPTGEWWVELKRTASATITLGVYTDATYGTLVSGTSVTSNTAFSGTGLRYLKLALPNYANQGEIQNGTVDTIEFYDNMTTASGTPTKFLSGAVDEKATLVDSNIPASDANWTTVTALTADTSTATPTNLDTASWDCNGADGDTTKISLTGGQIFPKDSSFTFSTWIKPDSKQTFCILDDDGGTDSVVIFAAAGGDAVEYKVWKDASTHSGGEATFSGGFAAGSWYNVVCTFDKDTGTTESYVNYSTNVNSDTEAGVTTVATNTSWKMIGNSSETYGGLMLESAIWNKVLTANERRDLYYGGSGGSGGSAGAGKKANTIASANLVCYWDGSDITAPITNQSTLVKTKIPENTLFDETDTYRTYFLKSSAWKRANPIINGFSAITVDPYTSGSTASTNAGWTLVNTDNSTSVSEGTGQSFHIDKSQDKLFWNTKTGADNSGSQAYYDCGVLADTWILQFKLKMNGKSDGGNQGVITAIGVKSDTDAVGSADASGGTYSPVQNYARFMFYSQSSATQLRGGVAGACGDLWGCDGNDSTASPNITGIDGTKTWYCQIKQTDEDTVVFTAGTDAYGGTTNGATATTNTALSNFTGSTHNFRYFFVETVSLNNGQTNRQHGYISEVKLADGVTSF